MQDAIPLILSPTYLLQVDLNLSERTGFTPSLTYTNQEVDSILDMGSELNQDVPRTAWRLEENKKEQHFGRDNDCYPCCLLSVQEKPEKKTFDDRHLHTPSLIRWGENLWLYSLDLSGASRLIEWEGLDGFETLQFPNEVDKPSEPIILPDRVFKRILDSHRPTPLVMIESMMRATQNIPSLNLTMEEAKALYAFALSVDRQFVQGGFFTFIARTLAPLFFNLGTSVGVSRYHQLGRDKEHNITIAVTTTLKNTSGVEVVRYVNNYIMRQTQNGFCLVLQDNYDAQVNPEFWSNQVIRNALKTLATTYFFQPIHVVAFIPLLRDPRFARAFRQKISWLLLFKSNSDLLVRCMGIYFESPVENLPQTHRNSRFGVGIGLVLSALILLPLLLVIGPQALIAAAGSAILFGVGVALVVLIPSLMGGLIGNRLDRTARFIREFDHFLSKGPTMDNPSLPKEEMPAPAGVERVDNFTPPLSQGLSDPLANQVQGAKETSLSPGTGTEQK